MGPPLRRLTYSAGLLGPAIAATLFITRTVLALVLVVLVVQDFSPAYAGLVLVAQDQGPTARPFCVIARRYRFEPARIEVFQDDVVKIELRAEDIAHSWTVDQYRIAKRASPGQPVTFEFRADKPGTFPFYCNLQIEDGCRTMRGELIVKPRK